MRLLPALWPNRLKANPRDVTVHKHAPHNAISLANDGASIIVNGKRAPGQLASSTPLEKRCPTRDCIGVSTILSRCPAVAGSSPCKTLATTSPSCPRQNTTPGMAGSGRSALAGCRARWTDDVCAHRRDADTQSKGRESFQPRSKGSATQTAGKSRTHLRPSWSQ
jgi:hypothetical protein